MRKEYGKKCKITGVTLNRRKKMLIYSFGKINKMKREGF